jgi:RNA polymerase sigma-70 factor (ECF subfamily)
MTDIAVQDVPAIDATVRLAAGGDQAAFAQLVAEHHAAMARVAYVICGDAEATRDVVQSAWAIAWRRLSGLRQPEQVRSWLVAIAANEARQAVRRTRRASVVDISTTLGLRGGGDPAEAIRVIDLERVLAGIKPDDRALLAMRFVAGLDSGEIARQLGMSASGVRSRLDRLLDRLRAELDPVEGSRP